ncbi:MAG: hypothetical protein B7X08_02305 [Acidocella sp. 20-63-7]|nr:MAG: hypothetical protein B7X08_02305 [Acidocella sp. 20-63-7]HQT46240.1 pilus assembly protein [Acidocella sp.]
MKLRKLFHDKLGRRGIAAVEFALVMPVLLPLFIGTIEILTLYRTEAKLNALTSNVAQMVANETTPIVMTTGSPETATSLNDICQGAIQGLQPFPPSGLTIDIISVTQEQGPNAQPTTSPAHATTATYDAWEADSTVTGHTCSTIAGTKLGGSTALANAINLATSNPPSPSGPQGNTGMVVDPCDNAIIVQATLKYPGITGLFIHTSPTLTQTAFARWSYATPTTEVMCPTCTVHNVATQICTSSNTATN